jgi:hypothetical protein
MYTAIELRAHAAQPGPFCERRRWGWWSSEVPR